MYNFLAGGVVAMPGFLEDFFPEVLEHVDARSDGEHLAQGVCIGT